MRRRALKTEKISAQAFIHATLLHCFQAAERWSALVDYARLLRLQLFPRPRSRACCASSWWRPSVRRHRPILERLETPQVTPELFASYMRFHHRRLFRQEFQPTQFCFSVRRSDAHSPEGTEPWRASEQ